MTTVSRQVKTEFELSIKTFIKILNILESWGRIMVKQPILNCRIHQISETVTRSNVGTNIIPKSQQLLLINQRGHRIVSLKICPQYVFLCALSLSLSPTVLFVAAN
jgi:hypothetical protein